MYGKCEGRRVKAGTPPADREWRRRTILGIGVRRVERDSMPILSRVVFTLEEANRTLPLVRSIVSDVADKWRELIQVREEYGNSSPEHDRIMRELSEYVQELKTIGCHLEDFQTGIVDFPGVAGGKEIRLRWQLGEDAVREVDDDASDSRTPVAVVDPEEESE